MDPVALKQMSEIDLVMLLKDMRKAGDRPQDLKVVIEELSKRKAKATRDNVVPFPGKRGK